MPNNLNMMADLYSQLEAKIFPAPAGARDNLSTRNFLALANPGFFLKPDLSEDDLEDLYNQSQLVNAALESSFIYKQLAGSVDQKFWNIVDEAELPQKSLNDDEVAEIRRLEKWISDNQSNYDKYRTEYEYAVGGYEIEAHSAAPREWMLRILAGRRDDALRRWATTGRRDEYNRKVARIRYLNARDPNVYWDTLRDDKMNFLRQLPDGRRFYEGRLYPKVKDWPSASWTTQTIEVDESASSTHSRTTSWSSGASAGWGLWSFGASASGSTTDEHRSSEVKHLKLTFEALRVRIDRPWFQSGILSLGSWRWDAAIHSAELLSDGGDLDSSAPRRPIGTLPVIPTELLVVRSLVNPRELHVVRLRPPSERVPDERVVWMGPVPRKRLLPERLARRDRQGDVGERHVDDRAAPSDRAFRHPSSAHSELGQDAQLEECSSPGASRTRSLRNGAREGEREARSCSLRGRVA